MPVLTDEKVFDRIKKGDIAKTYLLFGQESYFVSSCVEKIIKKIVEPSFKSFNLNRFDGEKISFDAVYQSVEALPMMAERKVVAIKDVDIDKLTKGAFDELLEVVAQENETTVLIIYATELTYDIKKSARVKKLSAIIEKIGVVCEFSLKDKPTLKRALCARAKKEGIEMEMTTADLLIEQCDRRYGVLINELDKLIFFTKGSGENTIKPEYIKQCCIPSIDSTSFDLAKAILSKKYDRAFLLLDELFYQRIEALSILGALNLCFIDLYRAKCAVAASRSIDETIADFSYPANRKFAVKNAFRDVQSIPIDAIRRCIDALMNADITLKSSKLSDRLVLEQMIGNMI